jgi:Mg2+-importing ATPase
LFTLALAVGLTPQLLPAIVSFTLAEGARNMARAQVIVRRLTSIEDIGGIRVLCTDKTGTLTEGVVEIDAALGAGGYDSEKTRLYVYLNAAFETGYANPIDDAIRRSPVPGAERYQKLDEVPYDFSRKRQSVAVTDGSRALFITKGALTSVLAVCETVELNDGSHGPIAPHRDGILARFEELSRQGYRCLGVAFREIPEGSRVDTKDEREMTFLGILSLADPVKSGALESLARLRGLGISPKLVTGDNRHVAAKVASDAGLRASALLTGGDVAKMTDAALKRRARHVDVFCEVDPNQKERIILALKKSGLAVGYLGDGINDAAALHAADVGISVDTAVNVTKQAADIVLLRKDLSVLVDGVREGRRAFANTLKYVFITTSANFGNMFSMAGASLFADFLPMLPMQILLLNVLSDLPAMAIASDSLDEEMVARPRRWNVRAIGRFMTTFGLISSVFDFLTFFTLLALGTSAALFRAGWFQESLLSELLILLVIRTQRPFFRSRPGRWLFGASVGVAAVSVTLPYLPFASVLGFAAVPVSLWGVLVLILTAYVAASELAKRAFFRRVHM